MLEETRKIEDFTKHDKMCRPVVNLKKNVQLESCQVSLKAN